MVARNACGILRPRAVGGQQGHGGRHGRGTGFADRINREYFGGRLSEPVLGFMTSLESAHPDVQRFVRDVARSIDDVGFPAREVSLLLAWEIAQILPKIHPSAWDGMVPPITVEGRHQAIDRYVSDNRWRSLGPGDVMVELGCGFPPHTALDSARAFPNAPVVAVDPSCGRFMVEDAEGNYAVFEDEERVRYFQAGQVGVSQWQELTRDPEATRGRFRALLTAVRDRLPEEQRVFAEIEHEGATIVADPASRYAMPNMELRHGRLEDVEIDEPVAAIRCINVLIYFEHAVRTQALARASDLLEEEGIFLAGMNWMRSIYSRYSVHQIPSYHLLDLRFLGY